MRLSAAKWFFFVDIIMIVSCLQNVLQIIFDKIPFTLFIDCTNSLNPLLVWSHCHFHNRFSNHFFDILFFFSHTHQYFIHIVVSSSSRRRRDNQHKANIHSCSVKATQRVLSFVTIVIRYLFSSNYFDFWSFHFCRGFSLE